MTDAEHVFYQDIREKKSIKNSAFKTNRTGKGPVRFPSDYLSKKEKEAMNGECKTWNLNGFYSLDEFKKMPDDIKIAWINKIINAYNARLCDISTLCFGMSDKYLAQWLSTHKEVQMYINMPKRGARISQTDYERLVKAIEDWRKPPMDECDYFAESMLEKEKEEESLLEKESYDFTPEERNFISTYLAPISEEKEEKTMDEEKMIFHKDGSVEFEVDDADLCLPNMTTLKFTMEGFDMEFLELIRKRFGDQKVTVTLSVVANNE